MTKNQKGKSVSQQEEDKNFISEIEEELSLGPEIKPEGTASGPQQSSYQEKAKHGLSVIKDKGLALYGWGIQKAVEGWSYGKILWSTGDRKKIVIGGGAILVLLLALLGWAIFTGKNQSSQEQALPPLAKALYYPLSRPLVVRFDDRGVFSLVRVKVSFLVREEGLLNALAKLDANLKESFVIALAQSNSDKLLSQAGKQELLKNFLEVTNKSLSSRGDSLSTEVPKVLVESVLLQEFMMQ